MTPDGASFPTALTRVRLHVDCFQKKLSVHLFSAVASEEFLGFPALWAPHLALGEISLLS